MKSKAKEIFSIVLADDEVIERQYLQLQLNLPEEGFAVKASVANGRQLLDAYLRYNPDIVIADISMPIMDGLEACRIIRQMDSEVLLLVNTAYAEFDYAQSALNYGIDAFLLKPSDKESILESLRALIRRRAQIRSSAQESRRVPSAEAELYERLNTFYQALTGSAADAITKSCEAVMPLVQEGNWGAGTRLILFNILVTMSSLIHQNPLFQDHFDLDEEFNALMQLGGDFDEKVLRMMLRSSFKHLIVQLQESKIQKANPVIEMDRYLQKNFRSNLSLEDLEQKFFLSGAYLSQIYKEAKGISVFTRLRELRLAEACRLLEKTSLGVQQVALMSGYPNPSYFHRMFKQIYKMTPAEYRNKFHGN